MSLNKEDTRRPNAPTGAHLPVRARGGREETTRSYGAPAGMAAGVKGEPPKGGQSDPLNSSYATTGGTLQNGLHSRYGFVSSARTVSARCIRFLPQISHTGMHVLFSLLLLLQCRQFALTGFSRFPRTIQGEGFATATGALWAHLRPIA